MDDTRKYLSLSCSVCGESYTQQQRVYDTALWKDRCQKHRKTIHQCADCGVGIHRGSERCKKCSGKNRRIAKKHCVDCGFVISRKANKYCLSCWNKRQDQGKSRARTKFNASSKWKKAREDCFIRDNWTCQMCGARGGTLNAHHVKSYALHPDLRLDLSNLLTVCEQCHRSIHFGNNKDCDPLQ